MTAVLHRGVIPQSCYVEDLAVGRVVVWEETFSQFRTWLVCFLHGDYNPVHWSQAHARRTRFGRTIVHAVSLWARISRHLATSMPGVAWVSFKAGMSGPVYHGDVVTFTATVVKVEGNKASIEVCGSVKGEMVLQTVSLVVGRKKP